MGSDKCIVSNKQSIMKNSFSACQTEKENTVWYHLYVESKNHNKLVNIRKEKQTHGYGEHTSGYQWGGSPA